MFDPQKSVLYLFQLFMGPIPAEFNFTVVVSGIDNIKY